ncbi:MAG: hypothetical protein ACRDYA_03185 [Egibacteraceae bacterium]
MRPTSWLTSASRIRSDAPGLDPAEVRLVDPEPAGNQLLGQRVRDVERMLR